MEFLVPGGVLVVLPFAFLIGSARITLFAMPSEFGATELKLRLGVGTSTPPMIALDLPLSGVNIACACTGISGRLC